MDNARFSADRASDWRNWSFLTLQVQLAAERTSVVVPTPVLDVDDGLAPPTEDPDCEWARAKQLIRDKVGEIAFDNWFACSRQTAQAAQHCGISRVNFSVRDRNGS